MPLFYNKPDPGHSPDDVMEGTCRACGASVMVHRWQVYSKPNRLADARGADPLGDLPSAECPGCRARVYVRQRIKRTGGKLP